MLLNRYPES